MKHQNAKAQQALLIGDIEHPVFGKILDLVNTAYSALTNPLPGLRKTHPEFQWERIVVDEDGEMPEVDPQWQYLFESESSQCHLDERSDDHPTMVVARRKTGIPPVRLYFVHNSNFRFEESETHPSFLCLLDRTGFTHVDSSADAKSFDWDSATHITK